ncbi:MAG TPA: CaiB/BaiF CoA-transferase family protein [Stellaceae bacterium]|nr:CaiB/BaiF CoA-transferase family protein [Stellaceae bacterium]
MTVRGPLSGITVVDLSRILAGPYATFLMAEMGARVIKVEPPAPGDDARAYGPYKNGVSTYFASINRGKESISLDLKADKDKAIFEKLLERADVVVENFRPGTMEKLGYGWETLHARYPKLIYAAASGFGHSGPHSTKPSYDMVVQGMGGIMSITGHPDMPPARIGMSIGDIGAGLYTAVAINAAIAHRAMTGEATKIDVAMFDCQLALLENAVMRYTVLGEVPGPLGGRHPSIVPFEALETKDGWMIVAAGNDNLWLKLCEGLGRADLAADPRYKTNDLRAQNRATLRPELVKELRKHSTVENIGILEKAGVPCGPINNVEQALNHPQVAARNMLVTVDDPGAGKLTLAGNPLKFSAFPDPPTRDPAPTLDRDRAKILKELGL